MVWKRGAVLPFIVGLIIFIGMFWQVLVRGYVPLPMTYMLSWYEPWKTENTSGGVPTLPHKPVVDDAFRHLYPLRVIASQSIKSGHLPLWNPYDASGTPLLAIMHPGYLTPFGIFFLFLDPKTAWTVYILLQPIVLGAVMYWYMRTLRVSKPAALFSSIVVLVSGFAIVRLEYGEFLYVLAGLPVLLGIVEHLRTNAKHSSVFAVPICIALMILSGQPHMIVYTLSVYALYALIRLRWADTIRLALLSILGVVMAGIQLLPGLELFSRSTISPKTSEFIFDKFLLPVSHLVTIVIPNYFGNQATYNYFGPHDYVETIASVGSIPFLFALLSLSLFRSNGVVKFFVLLSAFAVLTTLQWPGAELFFRLPLPVLSSDVPSRIFVLVTFSLAVLSGFGFDRLSTSFGKKQLRILCTWGIVLGVIALGTFDAYRMKIPCPPPIDACRAVSLRNTAVELFGFAVASAALFLFWKKRWPVIPWLVVGVVVALGIYNAQKFLPFSPRSMVFPAIPVIRAIHREAGTSRYAAIGNAYIRANLLSIFGVYSVEYFDPLHIGRYAELVSYVSTGSRTRGLTRSDVQVISDATVPDDIAFRRNTFWNMTGVSVLLVKANDRIFTAGQPVWSDQHWQLYRRATAFPRAYFVDEVRVVSDPDREIQTLFDPSTNLRTTAVTEKPVPGLANSGEATGTAHIVSYMPTSVQIRATTSGNKLLVLSDTDFPGWNAYVDGVRSEAYRTNYAFRGVAVPEGQHLVEFRYEPHSVFIGVLVSIGGIGIWIALMVVGLKKRGKNSSIQRESISG